MLSSIFHPHHNPSQPELHHEGTHRSLHLGLRRRHRNSLLDQRTSRLRISARRRLLGWLWLSCFPLIHQSSLAWSHGLTRTFANLNLLVSYSLDDPISVVDELELRLGFRCLSGRAGTVRWTYEGSIRDGNGAFSSLLGRCDHTCFAFDRLILMFPQGLLPSWVVVIYLGIRGEDQPGDGPYEVTNTPIVDHRSDCQE